MQMRSIQHCKLNSRKYVPRNLQSILRSMKSGILSAITSASTLITSSSCDCNGVFLSIDGKAMMELIKVRRISSPMPCGRAFMERGRVGMNKCIRFVGCQMNADRALWNRSRSELIISWAVVTELMSAETNLVMTGYVRFKRTKS